MLTSLVRRSGSLMRAAKEVTGAFLFRIAFVGCYQVAENLVPGSILGERALQVSPNWSARVALAVFAFARQEHLKLIQLMAGKSRRGEQPFDEFHFLIGSVAGYVFGDFRECGNAAVEVKGDATNESHVVGLRPRA